LRAEPRLPTHDVRLVMVATLDRNAVRISVVNSWGQDFRATTTGWNPTPWQSHLPPSHVGEGCVQEVGLDCEVLGVAR
jgi:hypothetical protein